MRSWPQSATLALVAIALFAYCSPSPARYLDYFASDPRPHSARSYCAGKTVDYSEIGEAMRRLWIGKNFETISEDNVWHDLETDGGVIASYDRTPINGGNFQYILRKRFDFVDRPRNTAHFTEAAFIATPYGSVIYLGLTSDSSEVREWHVAFTYHDLTPCRTPAG